MNITFVKANPSHIDTIFVWLRQPHMIEFWDNTQEHKDDILNFIHGRKQTRFAGTTHYWIGYIDGVPYSFLLSDILEPEEESSALHKQHMSVQGHTISIDFGIGNPEYLGQGLAAPTLDAFVRFYISKLDPLADTFFLDLDVNNARAQHVYAKAGFELAGEFSPTAGGFIGQAFCLMVKKVKR